jgi:FixJ family two-component response regulator
MKRIAKLQTRARGPKDLERCVFVVDDDQSVRTSLATLLSTEDYVVETFAIAAG